MRPRSERISVVAAAGIVETNFTRRLDIYFVQLDV